MPYPLASAQRAMSPAALQDRQRAVAPRVGAAAQHLIRMLDAYGNAAFTRSDGGWGDEDYRSAGMLGQEVGIALFPALFDAWHEPLAPVVVPMLDFDITAGGIGVALPWSLWPIDDPTWQAASAQWAGREILQNGMGMDGIRVPPRDPHHCSWQTDPEAFADQIETVANNLYVGLSHQPSWQAPVPPTVWLPAAPPPSATAILAPYVAAALTVVTDLSQATGVSYSIPVIGWALAIVDLIIQVLYWIFGTAQGVTTEPIPLQAGEAEAWPKSMATTIAALQLLDDDARRLLVPGASTFLRTSNPGSAARATTARQIVAVTLGTGAALALVWWLWA